MEATRNIDLSIESPVLEDANTRSRRIANWVSGMFSPPLVSIVAILVISFVSQSPDVYRRAGLFIFIAVIIPVLYTLWLMRCGVIADFHINRHTERIRPLLGMLFFSILAWLVLRLSSRTWDMLTVLCGMGVLHMLFIWLVTIRWKISGHVTAISSLVVLFIAFFGVIALPAILTIPLVAWARIRLRLHTRAQALYGALTGIFFSCLGIVLFHFVSRG